MNKKNVVNKFDARLNYLDKRGFLQPLWAATMQGRVGCAVDL